MIDEARRCCNKYKELEKKFNCLKSKLIFYNVKKRIKPFLMSALTISGKIVSNL